jgi:hypothetical protein
MDEGVKKNGNEMKLDFKKGMLRRYFTPAGYRWRRGRKEQCVT